MIQLPAQSTAQAGFPKRRCRHELGWGMLRKLLSSFLRHLLSVVAVSSSCDLLHDCAGSLSSDLQKFSSLAHPRHQKLPLLASVGVLSTIFSFSESLTRPMCARLHAFLDCLSKDTLFDLLSRNKKSLCSFMVFVPFGGKAAPLICFLAFSGVQKPKN